MACPDTKHHRLDDAMSGIEADLSAAHTPKGHLQRELMPEPLADVLEREERQRTRVAAELRRFTRRTQA